ncbi:MAG TPA: hypothetical protein PLX23_13155, partial [Candidatus Hydrogenedens sp.]|nr:hypothetical protein [Candidatus Hydrogenedens sp.]
MDKEIHKNTLFLLFVISAISLNIAYPSYSENTEKPIPLWKKAEIFQQDMEERFLLDGQALCKLALPNNKKGLSYNMPDNAYMTGIYVGTLSMKYLVTKDEK